MDSQRLDGMDEVAALLVDKEEEVVQEEEARTDKHRRGQHIQTEVLGGNAQERRKQLRASLEAGFYSCLSGKRSNRTLQQLGSCLILVHTPWTHLTEECQVRLRMKVVRQVRRHQYGVQRFGDVLDHGG